MDKGAIDTVCIYCPDTDECYYVQPDAHGASVTSGLRPAGIASRQECWRLPHFATYPAKFDADLGGRPLLSYALSMSGGVPKVLERRNSPTKPRVFKAACRNRPRTSVEPAFGDQEESDKR